jgi:uncharacterized protein (TIGR03000 family)
MQPAVILAGTLWFLFAYARFVPAQLMSKWGHPVFTVGATPYDSINQGHGNYPGGPGFIPGYGYYRPGAYPWLDGPADSFDRRAMMAPISRAGCGSLSSFLEGTIPANAALVIVKIPQEAELWLNDAKTLQAGSNRQFVTPPLTEDVEFSFTVRARWRIKNAELSRTEIIRLRPGAVVTVNFLTVDGWTGRLLETESAPGGAEVLPRPREIRP